MPKPAVPLGPMSIKVLTRFMTKIEVDRESRCWVWTGRVDDNGYGRFARDGESRMAHRSSFEHFVGLIPAGLYVDHLCRNRACVNPSHLEAVTHAINIGRGISATKTHCVNGHMFDENNTFIQHGRYRGCRTCRNTRTRQSRARYVEG